MAERPQNHPMTDVPCFFVHPCRTADALREIMGPRKVSELEYLLTWIGLIGASVGLNLPKELAIQYTRNQRSKLPGEPFTPVPRLSLPGQDECLIELILQILDESGQLEPVTPRPTRLPWKHPILLPLVPPPHHSLLLSYVSLPGVPRRLFWSH